MISFGPYGPRHYVPALIIPAPKRAAGFVFATLMKRVMSLYGLPMSPQSGLLMRE